MIKKSQVLNRHKHIIDLLEKSGKASLSELCEITGCSETTIRNDLRSLDEQGKLRRTFGGAIKVEDAQKIWLLNVNVREKTNANNKVKVARYAVEHILKPDMTIVLDAGTSCTVLAQEIAKLRVHFTVLTTSLHAALALAPALDVIDLYVFGGMYNPVSGSLYDEFQAEIARHLRADLFFLGADAVDADAITITGFSGFAESASKRSMISMAAKTYVLADHSKFGNHAMKFVCNTSDVAGVITDAGIAPDLLEDMRRRGIHMILAE